MKRILVVDDSRVARRIVLRTLKIVGFEESQFEEAGDGSEAMDLIRAEPFDLVVTDLNMPVMDGVTLLRKLKASPRFTHIPVIVVSSILSDANRERLRNRGVEILLDKPLSPAALSQAIERINQESVEL